MSSTSHSVGTTEIVSYNTDFSYDNAYSQIKSALTKTGWTTGGSHTNKWGDRTAFFNKLPEQTLMLMDTPNPAYRAPGKSEVTLDHMVYSAGASLRKA